MRGCPDSKRNALSTVFVVVHFLVAGAAYSQPRFVVEANTGYFETPSSVAICGETGKASAAEQALRLVCRRSGAPTDTTSFRSVIVIGFVGGFVDRNDSAHPELQFATYLRERYAGAVQVEVFANHEGKKALNEVLRLLDRNRDGHLTAVEKEQSNIVILGHSWGASEAVTLARELGRRGIQVMLTIQVDSIAKLGENDSSIPPNVLSAVNFYQTQGVLRGCSRIRAVDPDRTKILGNFHVAPENSEISHDRYPWLVRVFARPHIQLENDPRLWDSIAALIDAQLLITESAGQISLPSSLLPAR